jgi:hypothetical protein
MEAIRSSETLAYIRTTTRYIPEDGNFGELFKRFFSYNKRTTDSMQYRESQQIIMTTLIFHSHLAYNVYSGKKSFLL